MKIIFMFMIFFLTLNKVQALDVDLTPNAKSAILIENSTGKIIYSKNPNERLAPASMTKLASMLIIMEEIEKGNLNFKDNVIISERAANMGGSQVFLGAGESYSVKDLFKSVAIASGNDAVVALAEKIAGSEEMFVEMMNKRLKEIGACDTNFVNVHGLDEKNHYSTAHDMSIIAKNLLKYKDILKFTSIYEDYLEKNDGTKTWLVNTNKLVRFYKGVDGLKTGFTNNAGYCLTATAKQNDFRLISVVMGEPSSESRSSDTVKLLNYGFNTYKLHIIKNKNEILGKARIEKGKNYYVKIRLLCDATELLKNSDKIENYDFKLKVNKKIVAPLKVGDIIGTAEIIDKDKNIIDEVDLTISKNIKKANLFDYILRNFKILTKGKILIVN